MQQININSDLLVAQPSPGNKVSWTLASRLGDMLGIAERLFGERDASYTLLGIQFQLKDPHIWYCGKHRKDIIIRLYLQASTGVSAACYQMAYGKVHLLVRLVAGMPRI